MYVSVLYISKCLENYFTLEGGKVDMYDDGVKYK